QRTSLTTSCSCAGVFPNRNQRQMVFELPGASRGHSPRRRISLSHLLGETPSTKPQAPEKFQIPNPNPQPDSGANGRRVVLSLELGIWSLLSGLLGFSKIEMLPFSTPDGPARLLRP